MTHTETPEDRVRAFVEAWNEDHTGALAETLNSVRDSTGNRYRLDISDLRDMLAELTAANRRIDELEERLREARNTLGADRIMTISAAARRAYELLGEEP